MPLPGSLTRAMTAYLIRQALRRRRRFPLVLMLEPLHACNLACAGCGRIREYAAFVSQRLSIPQCLAAAEQCGAPVVSVCGGEPLLYAGIEELVDRLIAQGRHVYLCTNGLLLEKQLPAFRPRRRLFLNVHLDGLEATHDRLTGQPGAFAQAVAGIKKAKAAGFLVTTNTTVYRQTDMHEVLVLLEFLTHLGVDGFMLSPAYGYEAVCAGQSEPSSALFMPRREIHAKFASVRPRLARFRLVTSPIYLDFLCGQRALPCAAWANPTYNVCGWKGPCYLITDRHWPSYQAMLEGTAWDRFGPGNDPRCADCLVHCGFEPAAVLAAQRRLRDAVTLGLWHFCGTR